MSSINIRVFAGGVDFNRTIQTRWNGMNLAVHSIFINKGDYFGPAGKNDCVHYRWTLTHKNSGFVAARFTNLKTAIKVAKLTDKRFNKTAEELKNDNEFCDYWRQFVYELNGLCG